MIAFSSPLALQVSINSKAMGNGESVSPFLLVAIVEALETSVVDPGALAAMAVLFHCACKNVQSR